MNTQPKTDWRERLSSPLTWHVVAFTILVIFVAVLATRFAIDWAALRSGSSEALAQKQVQLKALELETRPLRGLDKRVDLSRTQIRTFFDKRIPDSYSAISAEVGGLAVKSGIHLTRIQYTQAPSDGNLTEITLDAGLSGDYPQIMRFINAMERDKTFFVIRAMGLTGQQGGLVNLRLRVSTWLRPEAAATMPATSNAGSAAADQATQPQGAPQR
jgi:Tfp pilus assembly protein PilO